MTADAILIIAGSALILIGLAGGGIKSKYGSVERLSGKLPRILCILIGFVLIGIEVGIEEWPAVSHSIFASKPDHKSDLPFLLGEHLPDQENDGRTREFVEVKVYIDDALVTTFQVLGDDDHPPVQIVVQMPAEHTYTLAGYYGEKDSAGLVTVYRVQGSGNTIIRKGSYFKIELDRLDRQKRIAYMRMTFYE